MFLWRSVQFSSVKRKFQCSWTDKKIFNLLLHFPLGRGLVSTDMGCSFVRDTNANAVFVCGQNPWPSDRFTEVLVNGGLTSQAKRCFSWPYFWYPDSACHIKIEVKTESQFKLSLYLAKSLRIQPPFIAPGRLGVSRERGLPFIPYWWQYWEQKGFL